LPQESCFVPFGFKHVKHEKVGVEHLKGFEVAQTCNSKNYVRAKFMFFNEYRELYITVVIVIYRITVRFKTNQFFIAKLCVKIFKEPTQKAYIEYNLSE
jgi:hypothetical protein